MVENEITFIFYILTYIYVYNSKALHLLAQGIGCFDVLLENVTLLFGHHIQTA